MAVVIVRDSPGGTDPYGEPVEGVSSRRWLRGAFTAPRTSSDIDGPGRDGVVIGLTLFSPDPTADLLATDQVEVDGTLYEIDGEIGRWRSPHGGGADGISVALKRGVG